MRIRDGENLFPGSELNIPDPQHSILEKLNAEI